jgi:hypothetical protein
VRERLGLLGFVLALLVGAATLLVVRASARGEFAEPFSTYRSEPDGARALYLLAQRQGLPVSRRHIDLEGIEGTPELVLLGVEGDAPEQEDAPDAGGGSAFDRWSRGRLSRFETDALLKAINGGATLIYGVTRDHPFLSDLGVTFTAAPDHASRTLTPFSPTPLTTGVHTLQTRISGYLESKAGLPVLIDRHHDDQVVALLLRRGKGRVLITAAPSMAANRELPQDDAARLWLNLLLDLQAPGGSIEFDEFHHGFTGERSVMAYATRYGLQWAIVQGIFALALFALALRRFGAARPVQEDARRASTDHLLAMARIYQQGGHRLHAARALLRGVQRALQSAARADRQASLDDLADALTAQGHPDRAAALLALAHSASPDLSESELVALATAAAALRQSAAAPSPTPRTEVHP